MLTNRRITAFIATAQPGRARQFYGKTLGLRLVSDDRFAVVFDCAGVELRIQKVETLQPHPFTALGWHVTNIRESVSQLAKRGIVFERYGFMEQDELGVWQAPSGANVAWFKDPDGNLLSLTQTGMAGRRRQPTRASKSAKPTRKLQSQDETKTVVKVLQSPSLQAPNVRGQTAFLSAVDGIQPVGHLPAMVFGQELGQGRGVQRAARHPEPLAHFGRLHRVSTPPLSYRSIAMV